MECNVIGMRVAEALPIIDKYLDNAMLAKANNVRIITVWEPEPAQGGT